MVSEREVMGAFKRLAPSVDEDGVWEKMHRDRTSRRPRLVNWRVLVAAASMVLLVVAAFQGYERLHPEPMLVLTDEELGGGGQQGESGPFSATPPDFGSPVLVAEGWVQMYSLTDRYLLFATLPEEGSEEPAQLWAYDLISGQKELLDEDYAMPMAKPTLSGDRVAWLGVVDGRATLLVRDLIADETEPMLQHSGGLEVNSFRLDGDLLLVEASQERALVLNLYDLSTGKETQVERIEVSTSIGYGEDGYLQADLDRSHVVWSSPRAKSREIVSYDLQSGSKQQLTDNAAMDFKPRVSGDLVTWLRGTESYADVYARLLQEGDETLIGQGVQMNVIGNAFASGPQTDGRYVAWWRNPAGQIVLYDSNSGQSEELSGESNSDGDPHLAGGTLVWLRFQGDLAHIVGYRPGVGAEPQTIASDKAASPLTNGRELAWFEYQRLAGSREE